jgi:hypothetical protein
MLINRKKRVSPEYWRSPDHVKLYMDFLSTKLKIQTLEDWYKVSLKDVQNNGGRALLEMHQNSMFNMISSIYPEYPFFS